MHTLIFLNGKFPDFKVVKKFVKKNSFIVAADGGANYLKKIGVKPDVILGDLDSISKGTLNFFQKNNSEVIKVTDQNKTDFEKCLIHCLQKGKTSIRVFGAVSLRPDHTLNNFSILKRYYKKSDIKIITDVFEIFFIKKETTFKYKKGEVISLLALPKADKIITTGLEYRLSNQSLEFGVKEGTLNKSISDKITISFKSGNILLFKKHFIQ
ncbi:MAG: thiamine diphosphokinase [Ignavibacteria bacterium]|nr:thiamine diphosphokinase [Ignavibacteria bacterium]